VYANRQIVLTSALCMWLAFADPNLSHSARDVGARVSQPRAHIVVIVMENHEYPAIVGSRRAPYINALAAANVLLTRSFAIRHPSLPNYLSIAGGSTCDKTDDDVSTRCEQNNIFNQLQGAGISWKAYEQSMPRPCYRGARHGSYYLKHDPAMMYADIRDSPRACANVVPYWQLAIDLSNDRLPPFAFITPNICDDMHSCSIADGDAWLAEQVPLILRHLGSNGVVIVTFDEGTTDASCCDGMAQGGHIATIIAGPGARAATRITTPADHYSLLRLLEDNWALPALRNAKRAPRIRGWQA
jgi:hypothetical protein